MGDILNQHRAPRALIRYAEDDQYSKGRADFSATGLLEEPRIVALEATRNDLIKDDPYENPWKFLSNIFHHLMSTHAGNDEIAEERIFTEFEGVTISGAMDLQIVEIDKDFSKRVRIGDYKFTTLYGIRDTLKWEQQLNIYAWLIEREKPGLTVDGLEIYAFLRDWRIGRAEEVSTYPQTPGLTIDLPLWDHQKTEDFVREKIELHREAQKNLPFCSHEGRWPTGKVWKIESISETDPIIFRGDETFPRKMDAAKALASLPQGVQLDAVITSSFKTYRRCKSYCHFESICDQWQDWKQTNDGR